MSNKEQLDLAERVQNWIQETHPHFWLIKRRDEIKKELKRKMRTVNLKPSMKTKKRRSTFEKFHFLNNPDHLSGKMQFRVLQARFDI
jgi:hypothetical protein